ncbi:hypothetical protein HMPREF1555_01234 [Porphyromonas gingivalis F0570]|uniref:Uncharacterized protein n=1 Tax=Porphyromonas gingivalis F0570 TaxID=1227271 RepID=A0A0E2LQW1_PORGN|nr:hypothetical protein HMPREF1555_01234 [Porphyromonas gingivalis F0570]
MRRTSSVYRVAQQCRQLIFLRLDGGNGSSIDYDLMKLKSGQPIGNAEKISSTKVRLSRKRKRCFAFRDHCFCSEAIGKCAHPAKKKRATQECLDRPLFFMLTSFRGLSAPPEKSVVRSYNFIFCHPGSH